MKPMEPMKPMKPMEPMKAPEKWWPGPLGESPNSAGGQNDVRYAYFAGKNRLAVDRGGKVEVYDTTGHQVSGVQSHGGSGGSGLEFTSDQGKMDLASLKKVGAE